MTKLPLTIPSGERATEAEYVPPDSERRIRSNLRPWLPMVVILITLLVGGYLLSLVRYRVSTSVGGLSIDQKDLDIGEVWSQEAFRREVALRNLTDEDVEVEDLLMSCSCEGTVAPKSLVIPAHDAVPISITFNLVPRNEKERGAEAWDFEGSIAPLIKDGSRQGYGWRFHGRVRNALSFSPSYLDFGGGSVEGQPYESRDARIASQVPLEQLKPRCSPAQAAVTMRRDGEHSDRFLMRVTPSPDLPLGRFRIPVYFDALEKDGGVVPTVPFYAEGEVTTDIRVLPARLDLGSVASGETVKEQMVVQSISGQEFVIKETTTDSPGIQIHPGETGEMAAQHTLGVAARFQRPGSHFGTIKIRVLPNSHESTLITVPVCCYVIEVPAASRVPSLPGAPEKSGRDR